MFFFEKGKFIRLFYSPLLPKIIQRVALPIEQKFLDAIHANTAAAYTAAGKFNVSGTGLSREKPKKAKGKDVAFDVPTDKKPAAGKEGPKPSGKDAKGRNGFDHLQSDMLDTPIKLRGVRIHDDNPPRTRATRSSSGGSGMYFSV